MIATARRIAVIEREAREVSEMFAARLRRAVPIAPSEWVPKNITLSRELSPGAPGPMDPDYKPWTRAFLDWRWKRPGKRGLVVLKRAQVGITTATMALFLKHAAETGGPILYMNGDLESSKFWSTTFLNQVLEKNPKMAAMFEEAIEADRRSTGITRPFTGGRWDFTGGGTVAGVTGKPFVLIGTDEIDVIEQNFPKDAGSPWGFVKARTLAVQNQAYVYVFSHPRTSKQGVAKIFREECERFAWCFDCPKCGGCIRPAWSMVRYETASGQRSAYDVAAAIASGELNEAEGAASIVDASMARLHCAHCEHPLSESERRRAVWASEKGGSGRFEREDGQRGAQEYDGVQIHGLSDPDISVASMAAKWLACTTELDRRTFLNLECGEVDDDRRAVVTVDRVREAIKATDAGRYRLPPAPRGVFPHLIVAGVDVQFPIENPTLYATATAYTGTGAELVLDMQKLAGWAALAEWLRASVFTFEDGGEAARGGITAVGIDSAWETGKVLDFCRHGLVSAASGAMINLVPMRFQSHVKATCPAVMPSEQKRTDPSRPHLGPIEHWDLHRDTWVGRSMKRWNEPGRRVVVCRPPPDLISHATANVLVPEVTRHGWETANLVWEKIDKRRDDWQMSLTYAEAVAAIKCGLDRVHELVMQLAAPKPAAVKPEREWIGGGEGWF